MPSPPDRTQQILAAATTISDKIRALNAEGHPRAEIARLLGKRYQYVRNVLEGDKQRRQAPPTELDRPPAFGVEEAPAGYGSRTVRLRLAEDGSVHIPASVLSTLGLKPGMILITDVEKDRMVMLTPRAAMARARAMAAPYAGGPPWASDELIADRRAEDAREREND